MMSHYCPIAPQCTSAVPTAIVLKENKGVIGSDDSAKVKDSDGNMLFSVDAHFLTLSNRRTLKDASGNELGQLRKRRRPGFHQMYYLGPMSNEKKCAVKSKGTLDPFHCDADIYVDDEVVGEVRGNWRAKEYKITIDQNEVAHVARQSSLGSLSAFVFDADTYCIDVMQPGVDLAFVALVAIALDELYHDDDD